MASIRALAKTGNLFIDFRFAGQRCREYTALPDTASNRKRLQKLLDQIEAEMATGEFDYGRHFPNSSNLAKFSGTAMTEAVAALRHAAAGRNGIVRQQPRTPATPLFKDFAETWWSEKEIEWRRSHKVRVREDLDKRLIPEFGDKEVGQITKADILAFRAALAKVPARGKETTLSNVRINKILNPLRQILCEAADRFDFRTPFQHIRQLRPKKADVEPFTLDEVKRILDTVRPDFRNYFVVRFFTGMRTGEFN